MIVPRLRAPIVLVHGLFGFTQVRLGKWVVAQYFRDVPRTLREAGNRVLLAPVSPTGGIADRAAQLKRFLDQESPHEPVHILGHSMGGLYSRYMISRLGMADRVLSLTSLGTPHRGSPFADWAMSRLVRFFHPVFDIINLPHQAFRDLTTAACAELNRQTPDAPNVRYFSVAGHHQRHWLNPTWHLSGAIVERVEAPNDGVVSLGARHGEAFDVWDSDHLNLVNWPAPLASHHRDRLPDYAKLVGRLADCGM